MGKLGPTKTAARVLQVMKALQLITTGTDKQEACDSVGLSVWQYDEWLARENEALEGLQVAIAEAERQRISQLANAQAKLLNSLLETALHPGVNEDTQLRILKYIDALREKLETKHGLQSRTDEARDYLMSGPDTRIEDSAFMVEHELSRTKATVNIKTKADGSVDLAIPHKSTIIDIFPDLVDEEDHALLSGEQSNDTVS